MKQLFKYRNYLFGAALVGGGAVVMYLGFYGRAISDLSPIATVVPHVAAQANQPLTSTTASSMTTGEGIPVTLSVPDAAINIAVAQGTYDQKTQQWTLSNDKAQFAIMTSKPNPTAGDTFIYGHARSTVFARLSHTKTGSLAYVTTDSNQRFTYRLRTTYTTNPDDSSVLTYNGPSILTLQTCSGALSQNRTMYVFDFVGVSNV